MHKPTTYENNNSITILINNLNHLLSKQSIRKDLKYFYNQLTQSSLSSLAIA